MAAVRFDLGIYSVNNSNGSVAANATLTFYETGTTTLLATYSDVGLTIANTNPVVADADGRFGDIFLQARAYKVVLKYADGTVIKTLDPIYGYNAVGADNVGSVDTIADLKALLKAGLADGAYVWVGGYYAAGDNGGGAMVWSAASTATVNNGTVFASNEGGTGRWLRVLNSDLIPEMFGAKADGATDDAAAINAALATGKRVVCSTATYAIGSTLRLGADGQIFEGAGQGNASEPARTVLKWIGANNGTMVSISNGTTENWQNATISDMQLNGNSKASTGIEGYNDAISGGAWRNSYENISITGLLASSKAIYLGNGAFPSFAHDTTIRNCFISGATIGVEGKGSKHKLYDTTFSGCGTGVNALTGSDWAAFGCVYSQCTRNIDMGAGAGFNDFGGWHEDSTQALVRCTTSMTLVMEGGYYQTQNVTNLIDLGNAQGYFRISGQVGPTSASFLVKNVNGNTEYDALGSNVIMESGYRFRAQGTVRADQAAFAGGVTSDATNATGDGTAYNVTPAFTEQYDAAAAFNAANGTFTAPVFGYYQFTGAVSLGNLGAAHTSATLSLVTTGGTYQLASMNPGATRDASNAVTLRGAATVAMNSTDTAYLQVTVSGSTKTVTVQSGGVATNWRTRFEGRMI